jgi:hypothetical protein
VILVTGIRGQWQEKQVLQVMDVMVEEAVAAFLGLGYQNAEVEFLGFEIFG